VDAKVLAELVLIALAVAAIGLLVAVLAAIRVLNRLVTRIDSSLDRIDAEVTPAFQQARATFEKIEQLARTSDQVLQENLAATLEAARMTLVQVESTSRDVSDTFDGAKRVAKSLAAMTAPGAAAVVTKRILKTGNRLSLLAFGVGAGLQAFFGNGLRRIRR
jgi:hypothetical protein